MFGDNGQSFLSDVVEVRSGVPQDTVQGPILFNIFINGASCNIENKISLYADYSKVIGSVESSGKIETIQADLNPFTCWAGNWKQMLNV